jgi:hypothetical protein
MMNKYKFSSLVLAITIMLSGGSLVSAKANAFGAKMNLKLDSKTFLSDVYESDKFSGLIYEFDVKMSGDDVIVGEVRFDSEDGQWGDWILLTENTDFRDHHASFETLDNIVNVNPSQKFQFRFEMRSGADSILPGVELVNYETLGVSSQNENVVNNVSSLASIEGIDDNLRIISRESWGADDSLNYALEGYEEEDWEAIEEFEENPYVERVVTEKDGELLKWPMQYTNDVKFLVVHHTATSADLDNPRQAIRNIQYYHAVRRGWGDIGYNYVIDQQGNIYEGRDGGKDVIGGHSREVNKVSVGISVLGNYQENDMPDAVLKALTKLLGSLADEYNLDVEDYDTYEGLSYPVLGGHGDYSATSCPGIYGRNFLPILRNLVAGRDTRADYLVNDVNSLGAYVDSGYLNSAKLVPELINQSGKTWNTENTYLKVYADEASVLGSSVRNFPLRSAVSNGQIAKFDGNIYGKASDGLHELDADLYINGSKVSESLKLGAYVIAEYVPPVSNEADDVPEGSADDAPAIANPFYSFYLYRGKDTSSDSGASDVLADNNSGSDLNVSGNAAVNYDDPRLRVLISKFDLSKTYVNSDTELEIWVDGKMVKGGVSSDVLVWKSGNGVSVGYGTNKWEGSVVRVIPEGEIDEHVVEIMDYENRPSWNTSLNDNKFRGLAEFRKVDGKMVLINELGMESYLLGLAEVPDSEHIEKAKTIVVAARSYAYYYSNGHGKGLKFKGKPYHIDDSPERSQKYLGYGFETRSVMNKRAVLDTLGETVTWFGYDVVIPYFSQSDGRTRTPTEVWGWSRFKAPYLTSVDDIACKGGNGTLWGHGVGISGCGASSMAESGSSYKEIINYYLKGVRIGERY